MKRTAAPSRAIAIAVLLLSTASLAGTDAVRRFALVAGANDGGQGRVRLRYAASDAQSFAKLLSQLGGVRPGDEVVLAEPTREQLFGALGDMKEKLESARGGSERSELVVYYSGHSDDEGLLLGGERVGYLELRQAIERLPADVRLAILDSCSAGALLRAKGGKRVPPFLVDDSRVVRGHAFLTATSEAEAAQESDRIQGSFFTYALLTGLRGAADSSRDGKVTLHEAYQFAFDETLAKTERARSGPQHPAYDIQLAGTGDLVLTDLHGSSAMLVLGSELEGRLYLRDAQGRLVAELRKLKGFPMELGLEPGSYGATVEGGGSLWETKVELVEGKRVELSPGTLTPVAPEVYARRGDKEQKSYHEIPLAFSVTPELSFNAGHEPAQNNVAVNLIFGRTARLHGAEVGFGVNSETEQMYGAQAAIGGNLVEGEVRGAQAAVGFNFGHSVTGVQAASGANIARSVSGVQAAYVNVADDVRGLQVGLVNFAKNSPVAVGLVNVSGQSEVPIALVNVAKRSRVPIALVNVGDDADVPIALVNVIRHGYNHLVLSGGDLFATHLGAKLGGKHLYTTLGFGYRARNQRLQYAATFGLGYHVRLNEHFFVDPELVGAELFSASFKEEHQQVLASLRGVFGWQAASWLALTAGPACHVLVGWNGTDNDLALLPQSVSKVGLSTVRVFPGFVLGVQI